MTPSEPRKTIQEYLSGKHNEEVDVLVAENRGWTIWNGYIKAPGGGSISGQHRSRAMSIKEAPADLIRDLLKELTPYSTSLDATRELLAELTEKRDRAKFLIALDQIVQGKDVDLRVITIGIHWEITDEDLWILFCATPLQISVAFLLVKGIIK
jgi:uncharacterized protein YbdZ (MbtH family)